MQRKLLDILACPKCQGELACTTVEEDQSGQIISGALKCTGCSESYQIIDGIPRFVEMDNYASSFGYQWNRFRLEQIDSFNHTHLSEKRFYSETGWDKGWLKGKWVLDVGCGAGRFLDVASQSGAEIVGVDISNAVDAAKANLEGRENVHLVQASIYELPFRAGAFDACYCIGVIQHTPDPKASLQSLPKVLKENGRLAVTIYERKQWTTLNTKYLLRPVSKRLGKRTLLGLIKGVMPIAFPITEVAFRIPVLGRYFMFLMPVANYVNETELSMRQRYNWAILDTFDMLSPWYDQPQTEQDVEAVLAGEGIVNIKRLANPGVNVIGEKGKNS